MMLSKLAIFSSVAKLTGRSYSRSKGTTQKLSSIGPCLKGINLLSLAVILILIDGPSGLSLDEFLKTVARKIRVEDETNEIKDWKLALGKYTTNIELLNVLASNAVEWGKITLDPFIKALIQEELRLTRGTSFSFLSNLSHISDKLHSTDLIEIGKNLKYYRKDFSLPPKDRKVPELTPCNIFDAAYGIEDAIKMTLDYVESRRRVSEDRVASESSITEYVRRLNGLMCGPGGGKT